MRYFEKTENGVSTMIELKKVAYVHGRLTVSLTEGTDEKILSSAHCIHEDLKTAWDAVSELVEKRLFPKDKKIVHNGVVLSSSIAYKAGDKNSYEVKAEIAFKQLRTAARISMALEVPMAGYWEAVDKKGRPVHDPADEPRLVTDDDIKIFEDVFTEAYGYFYEGKRAPDEQPGLFDDGFADDAEEDF